MRERNTTNNILKHETDVFTRERILLIIVITGSSVILLAVLFCILDHRTALLPLVYCLGALFLAGSAVTQYFHVSLPANRLYRKCQDFREGRIYNDFIVDSEKIFPGLGGAVARLDGLLNRQNVLQLSTKQAEFLALQNQINPHFLYNTLDSIRGDALAAGMTTIADITEALSTFFRYTITDTKNLVTIEDEINNVENYFIIQKYRFGDKLNMNIDIPEEDRSVLKTLCPKLFLQPIVENAIFHGLEKKAEGGLITISAEFIDDNVHVSVSDNGIGMKENELIDLNKRLQRVSVGAIVEESGSESGGIALKNVCRRIKLLFGEQYGIRISSIYNIGTCVDITLPRRQKSEH